MGLEILFTSQHYPLLQNSGGIMHWIQPQVSDVVKLHCWHDLWEDNDVFLNMNVKKKSNEELDYKIFINKEYSYVKEKYIR